MTEERWIPVVGHEGAYEVSDLGRVRSLLNGGRILKQRRVVKDGRLEAMTVKIRHPDNPRRVHVLVLEAFVGPRPPGKLGLHGDGNPAHNHLGNLRWGTHVENSADAISHGTQICGERHHKAKITEEDVRAIRASSEPNSRLAERYGLKRWNVGAIKRRIIWKHVTDTF